MKKRTKTRLDAIQNGHDWREGQTYSGGGTYYTSTDVCRFCGLVRVWEIDSQNGNHGEWTFKDSEGDVIPIANVQKSCGEEPSCE